MRKEFNWDLGAAIGGLIASAIVGVLIHKAGKESERWRRKKDEVEKDIEWHRQNIENQIQNAHNIIDFHQLVDLHFSSQKVAKKAHELLTDSRKALDAISESLINSREEKTKLIQNRKATKSKEENEQLIKEIESLIYLRKQLFEDKDQLKKERNHFLLEVKRLNIQTSKLKFFIRDNTGEKGVEWYYRLQERTKNRKQEEVKNRKKETTTNVPTKRTATR